MRINGSKGVLKHFDPAAGFLERMLIDHVISAPFSLAQTVKSQAI
jgi:hypothetical protein